MRSNTHTNTKTKTHVAVAAIFAALLILSTLPTASAQEKVELNSAGEFAILAGSAVTNTGPSVINGDVGVHPGSSVTGFGTATVNGEFHIADAVAEQAKVNLTAAYNDAAGRPVTDTIGTELGGETLLPGVYDSAAGTFGITGELTLDADNDSAAVWIFQMGSTLTTAVESSVTLINGAQACNVFWQVGSSATLGSGTDFKGNILAQAAISMGEGAAIEGRALAITEAVTLINNNITIAECAPADDPPADDPPADDPPADDPPADDPPADDPPADDPPADDPPADDPPADDPPADDPPADDPPADDPPADDPPADDPPADCPTDLRASASGDSSITLTWDHLDGTEQYRIYRAAGDGAYVLHDEVDGDTTTFIDTDTEIGVTYGYEVRPVIAGVESENCDRVGVTAIPFFTGLLTAALAVVGGVAAYAVGRRRT